MNGFIKRFFKKFENEMMDRDTFFKSISANYTNPNNNYIFDTDEFKEYFENYFIDENRQITLHKCFERFVEDRDQFKYSVNIYGNKFGEICKYGIDNLRYTYTNIEYNYRIRQILNDMNQILNIFENFKVHYNNRNMFMNRFVTSEFCKYYDCVKYKCLEIMDKIPKIVSSVSEKNGMLEVRCDYLNDNFDDIYHKFILDISKRRTTTFLTINDDYIINYLQSEIVKLNGNASTLFLIYLITMCIIDGKDEINLVYDNPFQCDSYIYDTFRKLNLKFNVILKNNFGLIDILIKPINQLN